MSWRVGILSVLGLSATGWLLAERRYRRGAQAEAHAILSSAFADIAIVDAAGTIDTCNENWRRAAQTADPFVSSPIGERWLAAVPEANEPDLVLLRNAFDDVISGRAPEALLEYQWSANPEWRWAQVRLRRMAPDIPRVVVAHQDITARKRMEGEAHIALQELAHMNMRLRMGEVAASITHELAQSLTASLSNAQALKHMLAQPEVAGEEVSAVVDDISAANQEARNVLDRIRSLMRKEEFSSHPLDLNAIIMDVVHVLYSSAAKEGVLLVAHLAPDLPQISGDAVQLRQVALNLIINAVHATRGHRTAASLVRVRTSHKDGQVAFAVDDNGPGVAEDALPRLFEPYYTTKKEGLGVGLSISRSIVHSHGGSIEVTNLPQGGARFAVHFSVA